MRSVVRARAGPPSAAVQPGPHPAAAARLLARVRREWRVSVAVRSLARGVAGAACVAAALVLLDVAVNLPLEARRLLGWLPLVAGLAPVLAGAFRILRPPDEARLALLAEERVPALGNAFVTAITSRPAGVVGGLFTQRLDRALSVAAGPGAARPLVPLRVVGPLVALAIGAMALALLAVLGGGPAALLDSWRRPAHEAPLAVRPDSPLGRAVSGSPPDMVRFGALRWTASPPAYAGLEPRRPSGAEPIRALAGSGIVARVAVAGPPAEWSATLIGGGRAPVRLRDDRLEASFVLLPELRGVEFVGRRAGEVVARRVIPLTATPDEAPSVVLEEPARDEVLPTAAGALVVRARVTDDHGVAAVRLGWIRSRGSGESFAFQEGERRFERVRPEGAGLVAESRLDLAALELHAGDVLHLRAVASDRNDVTGPGIGVSATRVIRIAAEGEEHEVTALIGAPADVEERPVLSQRMIILMTEDLRDRAAALDPAAVAAEARRIAREQARLRARVGEILFVRSTGGLDTPENLAAGPLGGDYVSHGQADHQHVEGDETWDASDPDAVMEAASRATGTGTMEELQHVHDDAPVIAVNNALMGAYNAMFEAERALLQAAADSALPPENRALEILQRVREGERVFLRGRVTVPPVDVDAARGTGELTDVALAPRSPAPRAAAASASAALDEAVAALDLAPADAGLAISAVAARLLSAAAIDAEVAALLSRAAAAASRGRPDEAASHLVAARARLDPVGRGAAGSATARSRDRLGAAYHRLLMETPAAAASARPATRGVAAAETGRFTFATARYASGDWDSAPLVPTNLTHSLAQYTGIAVAPEPVVVDLASDAVFDHPFLFLTGHLPVRFTEAESRNVRAYIERGGFLFVDDHNHDIDAAFHRSAIAELGRIFGTGALQPLPEDHELYSAFFRFDDGPPTTTHELNGWGDGLIHEELLAILVDGRIGVLYSNKDYASEWNYHAANKRFLALDNTRFGVNVLVYALTR